MRLPLLALAFALAAFAGCSDDGPAEPAAPSPAPGEPTPEEPEQVVGGERPEPDACKDYQGTGIVSVNDQYITNNGADVQVHEESNGRPGLQTAESCPDTPDTRVL